MSRSGELAYYWSQMYHEILFISSHYNDSLPQPITAEDKLLDRFVVSLGNTANIHFGMVDFQVTQSLHR